jgi:hypothetical protein
MFKIVDMEFP